MGRARDLANILSSSGNVALDSEMGLSLITPTSIAVVSGSGSISATGAISFTSATGISLNGCFTSTYDNYKIVLNINSISKNDVMCFRFGTGGTPNTASTYYRAGWRIEPNSPSVTNVSYGSPQSFLIVSEIKGSDTAGYEVNLWNPFASRKTYLTATGVDNLLSGSIVNGFFNTTQSFTDFQLYMDASATVSGTVRIYGYRN
jgi:hypothetical protein